MKNNITIKSNKHFKLSQENKNARQKPLKQILNSAKHLYNPKINRFKV